MDIELFHTHLCIKESTNQLCPAKEPEGQPEVSCRKAEEEGVEYDEPNATRQ